MSPKKERGPKGPQSHNGAPVAKPERAAAPKVASNTTSVKPPWELPQYASLLHLRSRLIPLCRPNGIPGKCTCPHHKHEDASSGKAPIEKGWQAVGHKATWPQFDFNVGVRLGSGLVVLDIDPRNGGREAIADLQEKFQPLPKTPRVVTGGGGDHLYFKSSSGQESWKLPAGVELKASRSQVVAPGSLHQSGKLYEWDRETLNLSPAELPDWLQTKPTTDVRPRLSVVPDEDPRHEAWITGKLQWKGEEFELPELQRRARLYLRAMPLAISGKGGHDVTVRVAVVLVRGFLLKGQDALPLLEEWNVERAKPPWSKGELLHKLGDASKFDKFQWGYALRGERDEYEDNGSTEVAEPVASIEPDSSPPSDQTTEETEAAAEERTRKEDNRLVYVASADRFYFFPEGTDGTPVAQDQGLQGLTVSAAIGMLQNNGRSFKGASQVVREKRCRIVKDIRRWPSNDRIVEIDGQEFLNPFWQLIPDAVEGPCPNLSALVDAIGGEDGAKWVWNWAAFCVQRPNVAPGVCVVARGDPGVGKSKLGEAIGLCRGVYASVTNRAFGGEFNSKWADARFINAAEVMLADSRQDDNQRFLSLVTDTEIEFHRKNQPAYDIPNRIAWWLTSNLDNPVKVPKGDRRFTILDATAPSAQVMAALKAAWAEYEGRYHLWPELQAFKWKLLNYKLDVEKARRPLLNAAHQELLDANKSAVELFADALEENGFKYINKGLEIGATVTEGVKPGYMLVDVGFLHKVYLAWCKSVGMGSLGYMKFATSSALRRFPKHVQAYIRGVRYRMREVPIGTMEDDP